ncbi:MAG: glycosyltransferase family 1 protein [Planctomycetota bacterium]|nr:MAG: glycosyltransferase family 1 protein [Planctomycetota bacterium]REK46561.1 MAG: glycosyltransferase family 1 protein [Planctomycetota bacterium]
MHIVYLISNLEFGGAQKIAVGLAEEAVRRGHRATLVTVSGRNDYAGRLRRAGVDYETLDFRQRLTWPNVFAIARLRQQLVQVVKRIRPDVVHSQLFAPKIVLYGARSLAGCPIVETQQDNPPWWRSNSLGARIRRHIDRVFLSRTSACTTAISRSVQSDLKHLFDYPGDTCPVIYNFPDEPPDDLPARPSGVRRHLMMVTRLDVEKKGIDTALLVLDRVRQVIPEVRLTIVGDGPHADRVQQLVRSRRLAANVEFRGYRPDVYREYVSADVVLMPSRWEGFGISAAEAGAVGVPVVASRVGGLQEVVVDGVTGFTCDAEDVEAFVDRTITLLRDDGLYTAMSTAAKASIKERFSVSAAFNRYEQVYEFARRAA